MDENNNVVVRVPEQQFVRGEDGYSPVVTIEEIEHGHSINITDREHPEGQSFDVLDGASAYEQAVAGGYTGTEEEFNDDLSSFKELHDEVEEAAPFYAVYGVTTRAQIESAINNKRQIYLLTAPLAESIPQAYVMPLAEKFEYQYTDGGQIVISRGYRFSITSGTNQYIAELANGWTAYTNDLSAPADRAEEAAAQALNRMNSADASAQSAAGSASNASRDAGTASTAAETATEKAGEASGSATAADGSAKDAEAYAVGKRGGTDVGSTDPAYHNNSKYYAEQAASSASDAVTAKGAAETAQGKAEDAQEAAEQAQEAAEAVLESIPSDYTELSDDVDNLKSALGDTSGNSIINGWSEKYKYINTSGTTADINNPSTSSSAFRYLVINCSAGDVFTITAQGGSAPRAYAFVKSNGDIITEYRAGGGAGYTNEILIAPSDSAYLVLNDSSGNGRAIHGYFINDTKKALLGFDSVGPDYAENGSVDSSTGVPIADITKIRSGFFRSKTVPQTITASTGYKFDIAFYDDDFDFYSYASNRSSYSFSSPKFFRLVVHKDNGGYIGVNEFASAFSSSMSGFEYFGSLKGLFDDKESKEDSANRQKDNGYFTEIQMKSGYYIGLSEQSATLNTPTSSDGFAYGIVPCKEGDKFLLTIAGSNTPRAYGFVEEDGTIISSASANVGVKNAVITAPQNSAYLVINDNVGNKSYIIGNTINKDQTGTRVINRFHNAGYNSGTTPPTINYIAPKRIGNADYIFFNKGDIVSINNGTGFQYIARLYSGTLQNCTARSYPGTGAWTIYDINIIAPFDGFAVVMFADGEDRTADVSVSDFDGQIVVIGHEYADIFINKDEYINKKVNGVAYSWWVTNRTMDAYGNCYFGYISKDSYCGVGCKCPDGTVYYKNLWKSNNCNDHNAPSVNIVKKDGEEYVFVIGATGQAGDNVIHVCMARTPNTVMCEFINTPYEVELPDGYRATCTYSQSFVNGANIYNIFNCHQINTTSETDNVVKICMKSDDYGVTWKLYRVYYKTNLDYLWLADVEGSDTLKRILVSHNPGDGFYPISTGFIDLDTNVIYNGNMESIDKPMTEVGDGELLYDNETVIAEYDDFTIVVQEETGYRMRPLDLFETSSDHLVFLYAKAIGYNDRSDFILYRYNDGTVTEIGHLGRPFEMSSSYLTGANFLNNTDCIIYSKNDSGVQDGAHSLHRVKISSNAVVSDEIIKKTPLCIARPMRFGKAGIVYLIGKYKQYTSMADFLQWAFSVGFVDEY